MPKRRPKALPNPPLNALAENGKTRLSKYEKRVRHAEPTAQLGDERKEFVTPPGLPFGSATTVESTEIGKYYRLKWSTQRVVFKNTLKEGITNQSA